MLSFSHATLPGTRWRCLVERMCRWRQWGIATLVETMDAADAYDPQVVCVANRRAIAVWCQDDGTRVNVCASRYE